MSSFTNQSIIDFLSGHSLAAVTGTLGLLATVLLLVVLAEREVIATSADRPRSRLRVLDVAALPLLAVFVAVVVARFAGMSF